MSDAHQVALAVIPIPVISPLRRDDPIEPIAGSVRLGFAGIVL
jgi:hypothetical protein